MSNISIYRFALDMTPGGVTPVVHLSQYDDAFQLEFTLYSRTGELNIPSGATAMIEGTKLDGKAYSANAAISGNVVTVTGDVQISAVAGNNPFQIVLKSGNSTIGSANFTISVERAALDYDTVSDSKLAQIQDISGTAAQLTAAAENVTDGVETFEALAESVSDMLADITDDTLSITDKAADAAAVGNALAAEIAPKYSTSATYAVGDYVLYNNSLYRCNTAITTAESWTAAHWTAVKIGSELGDLKSDLKQNGLSYEVDAWVDGYRVQTGDDTVGSPTASASWRYLDVPCVEGDIFYLSTVTDGFSGYRPWAFADANGDILLKGDTSESVSDIKIIAPSNAVRLVVNDHDQYNTKTWTGVCYKNDPIIDAIKDISSSQDEAELKIDGTVARLGQSTTNTNMIDITSEFALTNAFISNTNGVEYADDRFRVTDYLNIYQYADLFITAYAPYSSNCFWGIYDADKNYLGYFRGSPSAIQTITDYHFYIDDILSDYPTAMYVRLCNSVINSHELVIKRPAGLAELLLPWTGKKWVCLGDSLTESNGRTTKNYHGYVADATGIQVVNLGISGSGYKHPTTAGNNAYYQRIDTVPTDADVVTIFGSGNDLRHGYTLGDVTDTGTTTICGCINTTLDLLVERIPTVQLGIIAPTPWEDYNPAVGDNPMEQYVNALKTICENRSIPFLDLYHCSNLRPWTEEGREACYSKDDGGGTHPDEAGHKIIAPRFKGFLDSLLL